MQNRIIDLSSALPVSLVGRKAAALGRLVEAGFPVPPGVCITTDAFHAATSMTGDLLRLPDGLLDALAQALPKDVPLAVRSSAVLEDLPEASLAGRYATTLNVMGPAALEQAVVDCWRSYLSVADSLEEGGMAVLVQPMLDAECAGVCFTVDPVRLRADLLLVVSAWGLGAGVMSGVIPTDTARLRRIDLQVEDFSIADKHTALRPNLTGGVTQTPVPSEMRAIACLPESWLERVGQYGLAIEQVFGAPQDVEWAVAGEKLWILQSRPVTALPAETREAASFPVTWSNDDERRHYWWLEDSGALLLPAELDSPRVQLKGGHDAVYYGGGADTRWRKVVNGRVYMAGGKSPHSPGHVRVYGAAMRDLYERQLAQGVTGWEYWGPEIVRATDRLADFAPHAGDGNTLADHLEDAIATATRHWMVHTLPWGLRPIRSAELLDIYALMTGRPSGELAADIPFLLAGSETIQTRLVEALYDLACLALESPETAKAIASDNQVDVMLDAPPIAQFVSAFQRLIAVYGDRLCYRKIPGFPVELPQPWREAPDHVWEMIAAYLPLARRGDQSDHGRPGPRETRLETLRSTDARIEALCAQALAGGADTAIVQEFHHKLAYARRNAAPLDEANHYIDQLSEGQYVQALIYAGRWLAAQDCIPGPFDVFWLKTDEILAALREPSVGMDTVLTERRAQFSEWQALIPPACLGLPDPQLPERPMPPPRLVGPGPAPVAMPANVLTGEPASRGCAAGRARLITGDALPVDTAPGDILVAPFASPVLIPFLPAMTALVLDYGGPGDHFAITAREFGVPAVCATLHATRSIPEGAWVTVDANSGLVTWE